MVGVGWVEGGEGVWEWGCRCVGGGVGVGVGVCGGGCVGVCVCVCVSTGVHVCSGWFMDNRK